MKEKKRFYLTNKEFLQELRKYYSLNKISNRLHEIFYLLSERIARKSIFYRRMKEQHIKSSDLGDAYYDFIHEGYLKCIKRISSFNIEKCSNPFSYFTSVITNAYKDFFNKEYRHEVLKAISQNDYEHHFLMTYGFPIKHIIEEN